MWAVQSKGITDRCNKKMKRKQIIRSAFVVVKNSNMKMGKKQENEIYRIIFRF